MAGKKIPVGVQLGNLDARRDWGYAPEYVEAMWRILRAPQPDDYVIGTGETHSVREFAEEAFSYAGLDWRRYVRFDRRYLRPLETNTLCADARKARRVLRWSPSIGFKDLVRIMVDSDLEIRGLPPPGRGKRAVIERFGTWRL